ncbi:hypothetical protein [Williamsia sp.]|uniref:hypothetical protein n=1 Tax=Williamsia sp. TaxID=1872085 RepID=UPI001A24C176|nr:hypothetical protein [Williamsia sp.]MBJ7287367.1 hypothetical protein [Williamsia sp.]
MRKPVSLVVVTALTCALWVFVGAGSAAAAAQPAWNGDYSLKRFAATKYGSSLAARQKEPDFSDVYTFDTQCAGRSALTCVSTVVNGPTPANPTLPLPPKYKWSGSRWVHTYDWQWDCYQGKGVPKVWAPAHSVAYYTPQRDGTFKGLWRTDIKSGPCKGSVFFRVAAYPATATPVR